MGASNWVYVEVQVIRQETDKAFLCYIDDQPYWIPKSQIADPDDYEAGDRDVEIGITEWIAQEKGLAD